MMIVYNITFSVDKDIAEEWLAWMKKDHLPSVATMFESFKILKVLSHDDEQTLSFAVQCYSKSIENIQKYSLNTDVESRFGERVLTYPTLLEEV